MTRRHFACQTILSAVVALLATASTTLCEVTKSETLSAIQTNEVSFPTIGLRMIQPVGFRKYVQGEIASGSEGFHHPGTGSNIRALCEAVQYSASVVHASVTAFQNRGISFVSGEAVNVDGRQGVLFLAGKSNEHGVEVSMWILLFDGGDDTKVMFAHFPTSQHAEFAERLKSALLGTKLLAESSSPGASTSAK